MAKEGTHRGDATGDRRAGQAAGAHARDPGLELLDGCVGHMPVAERPERTQVAAVGVDGARRPSGLESQEEAFDVGVGSTHRARRVSPGVVPLLLRDFAARLSVRIAALTALLLAGLVSLTGAAASATAAGDAVLGYPSSQSIPATGVLPAGGERALGYSAAIGERESAIVVVRGARTVAATVTAAPRAGIAVRLFFARFVSVAGRPVADALEPWDGQERAAERQNQPVFVQIEVPYGTRPGRYVGVVTVVADGRKTAVPLRIRVFGATLPAPGTRVGNLLTSFNLSPQSYVGKAAQLYGFTSHDQRIAANRALYGLLGSYRISPGSWGFGEPRGPTGYESSSRWWLDSAGNFVGQLRASPGFAALRIPISSNRAAPHHYIAQLSPFEPETWCDYLRRVHSFWAENEAFGRSALAYLFGYDEPGPSGQRLVARQAKALHQCFPGGRQLMTGNPSRANAFLWDNKGADDLDIWSVLSRRFYGTWTSPADTRAGLSRSRSFHGMIGKVRARGKMVWTYTYTGTPGTPGLAATEPLSNPRMLMLWTALEGIQGLLYTQGATSYGSANPFESIGTGEKVLLYPGPSGPMPSARLEQIRDGIEDWAILDLVRRRHGAGAVREILGSAGLFSASRARVRLACNLGCELKSATRFSWPLWSRDASTPRRIEKARLAALKRVG